MGSIKYRLSYLFVRKMVNSVNIEIEFNSFEQIGEYEIKAEMAKSCKVILI